MLDWDKLADSFTKHHYIILITFVVELTALAVAITYVRNTKIGLAFIIFISIDFCLFIIGLILKSHTGVSKKNYGDFLNNSNTVVSLVELLVYFYFFSHVLRKSKMRVLIKILLPIFILIVLVYFVNGFSFLTKRLGYASYIIGVTEFIFLLPFCLFYFYSILNNSFEKKLFDRPSFWIVTGIFFYSLISIPFYLINDYLVQNKYLVWIDIARPLYYLPFVFNFIFLIKAFLCKKVLTI